MALSYHFLVQPTRSIPCRVVDGRQFLIWDQTLRATDPIGNVLHHFQGDMGRYPIPIPEYELRQVEGSLDPERVTTGIRDIKTDYSLPFNSKNVDMLYKDCIKEGDHPTGFFVEIGTRKVKSLDSYVFNS